MRLLVIAALISFIGSCRLGFESGDLPGFDDAGSFVCSTTSMTCPGGQPLIPLSCGAPTDCWVGCRFSIPVSTSQAAAFCADWGGRLGNINSDSEEACVRVEIDGAIILGLIQAEGQAAPDAGWSWNGDGVAPLYTDWDNGQPNDGSGSENDQEQCAYSSSPNGWHDTSCDMFTSARFTCRYP